MGEYNHFIRVNLTCVPSISQIDASMLCLSAQVSISAKIHQNKAKWTLDNLSD
jgi:hypothetical protein